VTRVAWILLPVALAAGIVLPVQFGVNSQLRNFVGGPVAAAAISFVVGTVALAVAALVVQRSMPEPGSAASAPWWAWTGGLLGAFFVLASIILTPRLGAATTIGLILTGQVLASIVIDHFGLIRVPVHEASFPRIIGALLIVAGVVIVQRF
jgi:bacterial/archaeal transporter family-2 protein